MSNDIALILTLMPIAFLGSLIYGVTGFGSALVTIPLATHFVPLPFALSVFALVDFASSLRIGLQNPKDAAKAEIARLLPFILIGTVTGVTVLANLPRSATMLALGAFTALYAIYALVSRPGATMVSRHWAYLAGFSGGLTGALFGVGGPPHAIYLSHRQLSKEQFRATMTLSGVFTIGMRIVAFAITGYLLKADVLLAALFAVLAAMVGLSLSALAFRHVTRQFLLRVVAVLLFANGVSLIARAVG